MFHTVVNSPWRFIPATAAPVTEFHANGVRRVYGPLGVVEYDATGNARFLTDTEAAAYPPANTVTRLDLAA